MAKVETCSSFIAKLSVCTEQYAPPQGDRGQEGFSLQFQLPVAAGGVGLSIRTERRAPVSSVLSVNPLLSPSVEECGEDQPWNRVWGEVVDWDREFVHREVEKRLAGGRKLGLARQGD